MSSLHGTRAYAKTAYVESFKKNVKEINESIQRTQPSNDKYEKAAVFIFSWHNDDLNLGPLEDELETVFKSIYKFAVRRYQIPDSSAASATVALQDAVFKFRSDFMGPRSLLLWVYGGYGSMEGPTMTDYFLYGSQLAIAANGPKVDWSTISGIIDAALGDVLVIFDSCFSAGSRLKTKTETLCAAAFESQTPASHAISFSRRLIDLLNKLNGTRTTIAHIHATLHNEAGQTTTWLDHNPIYIAAPGKSSITLQPLPNKQLKHLQSAISRSNCKVLIKVNIEGTATLPNVQEWVQYLTTEIPSNVAEVTLEAVFESNSTVAFIAVPVEVWSLMADHPAYEFTSFIKSRNLLLESGRELVERSAQARNVGASTENQKPGAPPEM